MNLLDKMAVLHMLSLVVLSKEKKKSLKKLQKNIFVEVKKLKKLQFI